MLNSKWKVLDFILTFIVPGRPMTDEFVPAFLLLLLSRDKGTAGQGFSLSRDKGTAGPDKGTTRRLPLKTLLHINILLEHFTFVAHFYSSNQN